MMVSRSQVESYEEVLFFENLCKSCQILVFEFIELYVLVYVTEIENESQLRILIRYCQLVACSTWEFRLPRKYKLL